MLIAKQQQLKKAKLADNLNERLSHRPGVLELIKGNILLPSNLQIEQAVKEGTIYFKPTSAGETIKYPQPSFLILKKDQQSGSQQTAQVQSNLKLDNCSNETQSNKQYQKSMKSCNNYHFDHHCSNLLPNDNVDLIEVLGGRPANNETNNGVVSVNKVAELEGDDENDSNCSSYSSCSINMNENEDNLSNNNLIGDNIENNVNNSRQDSLSDQTSKNDTQLNNSSKLDQIQTNLQSNQVKQINQTNQPTCQQFTQQSNQKSNNTFHNLNNFNKLSNNLNSSINCSPLNSSLNKVLSNRSKKNKIKIQSKNKIIKFHEYKVSKLIYIKIKIMINND